MKFNHYRRVESASLRFDDAVHAGPPVLCVFQGTGRGAATQSARDPDLEGAEEDPGWLIPIDIGGLRWIRWGIMCGAGVCGRVRG